MNEELKRQAISSFKGLNNEEKKLLKNALDSIVSCYRVIGQENTENEKFLLGELAQFIDALSEIKGYQMSLIDNMVTICKQN